MAGILVGPAGIGFVSHFVGLRTLALFACIVPLTTQIVAPDDDKRTLSSAHRIPCQACEALGLASLLFATKNDAAANNAIAGMTNIAYRRLSVPIESAR